MSFVPRVSPVLDPLDRERNEIERRRKEAEIRRNKFLDPRASKVVVDPNVLERQIQEKKARERAEKEEENKYYEDTVHMTKEMAKIHAIREHQRKEESARVDNYRKMYQPPARPAANEALNPAEFSASSMQAFEGEDPHAIARKKYQQQQMRDWVSTSVSIQEQTKAAEKAADLAFAKSLTEMDALALELESKRRAQVIHAGKVVAKTNQELLNQKLSHNQANFRDTRILEEKAIEAQATSDFLNERVGVNALGAHRKLKDGYKGMSNEEKKAILDEQERQIREKHAILQAEKEAERNLATEAEIYRKLAVLKEREAARIAAKNRENLLKVQLDQDQDFKSRYNTLYKEVYTNQPTDAYFGQFGTSGR